MIPVMDEIAKTEIRIRKALLGSSILFALFSTVC